MAVSFALVDINDAYENFVLSTLSSLLIDGPSAPFYRSLLEEKLGTDFAPATGFAAHFKDTAFTVGVQARGGGGDWKWRQGADKTWTGQKWIQSLN